jgi:hypothetical protein
MERGKCRLCLGTDMLQRSHLIPRAVYALCRAPKSRNPNPLMVTPKFAMQTSRQLQFPLLCFACEQLLRKKGEDWVNPRLASFGGAFPLGSLLSHHTPEMSDPDLAAYALSRAPEISVASLIHFAMGIFWKASVHSWARKSAAPWIDLGTYGEAIRRYLLGISAFPDNVVLSAIFLPMPVKLITFYFPFETAGPSPRTYQLYVPGLQFTLWTGRDIAMETKLFNLSTGPLHVVLVAEVSDIIRRRYQEAFATAHKSRKLPPKV